MGEKKTQTGKLLRQKEKVFPNTTHLYGGRKNQLAKSKESFLPYLARCNIILLSKKGGLGKRSRLRISRGDNRLSFLAVVLGGSRRGVGQLLFLRSKSMVVALGKGIDNGKDEIDDHNKNQFLKE